MQCQWSEGPARRRRVVRIRGLLGVVRCHARRLSGMAVVRISKGRFDPAHAAAARESLAESEVALREAITALPGLVHYYVGIDEGEGQLTNVSVWESLEQAHQMDTLAPMLAQRPVLQAVGVTFETITNHTTLWTITP